MASEWKMGTLPTLRFGAVETVLGEIGRPAPIVTSEHISGVPEQHLMSMWDRPVNLCVRICADVYRIKKPIWHCFVRRPEANAMASYLRAHDEYAVILTTGILEISQAIQKAMASVEVQEFLGLNNGNGPGAENLSVLINIAIRWLAYHELGHIQAGHLHILADREHATSFELVTDRIGSEDENLTRQALEMDADFFAYHRVFLDVLGGQFDRLISAATATPLSSARSIAVAVYAVLRQFESSKAWTGANTFTFTHPPTAYRMLGLPAWGEGFIPKLENPSIPIDDWRDAALRGLQLTDKALRGLDNVTREQALEIYRLNEFDPYFERLLERWTKVGPSLVPHILGAPPAAAQL